MVLLKASQSAREVESLLQRSRTPPNFYLSDRLWEAAGYKAERVGASVVVWTEDGLLFPPITVWGELTPAFFPVFVDFEGYRGNGEAKLLDHEYIYNPASFLDLSGGARKVFRKNVHRFEREHPGWEYRVIDGAPEFLPVWLEQSGAEEFYGPEVALQYLRGEVEALFVRGKLVGVNAYDTNFAYTNFRYSFALREFGASEFLRWQFFLHHQGRLVHDGGDLGCPSLAEFKMKLGPVEVRTRMGWSGGHCGLSSS